MGRVCVCVCVCVFVWQTQVFFVGGVSECCLSVCLFVRVHRGQQMNERRCFADLFTNNI